MPNPTTLYYRVAVGGSMAQDVWSNIITLQDVDGASSPTGSAMNTFAGDVLDAYNTEIWDALSAMIAPYCKLVTATAYAYLGGVLVAQGQASQTPAQGQNASTMQSAPYQSVCVTLQTTESGRSGRGRMYLPLCGPSATSSTGQLSSTQTDSIADAAGALSKALEQVDSPVGEAAGLYYSVLSTKTAALNKIQTVKVDSILDTQRGRENRFTAISSSTAAASIT